MISREQVIAAYQLVFGRDPESEESIEAHMKAYNSVAELREAFFRSPEALFTVSRYIHGSPLDMAPPLPIEIDVDSSTLQKLLTRTERIWAELGKEEPYWSVITDERFKRESFAANKEAYDRSGQADVARFLAWLERNQIDARRLKHCLELGCGTGRDTQWLALEFESVTACDISVPHLTLARRHLRQQGCSNVTFHTLRTLEFAKELKPPDLFFSILVLQHNPPPVMAYILRSILQLLHPGGIAYFQIPTYCLGYRFLVAEYLHASRGAHQMEMHVLPQREVYSIAHNTGCRVLEVRRDNYAMDPDRLSDTFLLEKTGSDGVE
jgi:2-polyprenyl-3-methyl-5-hydroxy-6-metoxy-1,4-benzoquinol methylase